MKLEDMSQYQLADFIAEKMDLYRGKASYGLPPPKYPCLFPTCVPFSKNSSGRGSSELFGTALHITETSWLYGEPNYKKVWEVHKDVMIHMSDLLYSLTNGGIVPENYLKSELGFSPVPDYWEEDTAAVLRTVPEELSGEIKKQFSVSEDEFARVVGDKNLNWFIEEEFPRAPSFYGDRPAWATLLEKNPEVLASLQKRDERKKATAERASQEVSKWRQTMNLFAVAIDRTTSSPNAQESQDVADFIKTFFLRRAGKPNLVLSEQFAKVNADSPLSSLIGEISSFSDPDTVRREDLISFIEVFQNSPQHRTLQDFVLDHVLRPDFRDLTEAMTRFLILHSKVVSGDLETYLSDIAQHADSLPGPIDVKKSLEEIVRILEEDGVSYHDADSLFKKAQADWERAKVQLFYTHAFLNIMYTTRHIGQGAQQHLQTICPVSETPAAETEGPCPPAVP